MSAEEISIGGTAVVFKKSDSLVAIKPRPGTRVEPAKVRALTAERAPDAGRYLAGFELRTIVPGGYTPRDVLATLRQDEAIADGAEVLYTSEDRVPFVPTGEIYAVFSEAATDAEIHEVLDQERLAIREARPSKTFILTTTPASPPVLDVIRRLQDNKRCVEVAEPDLATFGPLKAEFALPTDELLGEQWHLRNTGSHRNTTTGFVKGADARVIEAWTYLQTLGSADVIVAVIDDGFDLKLSDLGGQEKVVAPHDFTRSSADPSPELGDWHGTACAGVAVGSANGQLIVGAAPAARLMPVRWGQNLSDGEIERWFDWVRERGAAVVSCSWGAQAAVFPLSTRVKAAISRCVRDGRNGKGTVVCFAAGNLNHNVNDAPRSLDGFAIHPDVIAVAACNSRDQRSHYSNFGKEIWVCAPSSGAGGWGVTTSDVSGAITVNGRTIERGYAPGTVTHDFGGTSSACPLVAGICALILSANPNLTASEVKDILRRTARKIGGGYGADGHSEQFGYGCVNALEAVRAARP
jgi:subtilisin family serine protease